MSMGVWALGAYVPLRGHTGLAGGLCWSGGGLLWWLAGRAFVEWTLGRRGGRVNRGFRTFVGRLPQARGAVRVATRGRLGNGGTRSRTGTDRTRARPGAWRAGGVVLGGRSWGRQDNGVARGHPRGPGARLPGVGHRSGRAGLVVVFRGARRSGRGRTGRGRGIAGSAMPRVNGGVVARRGLGDDCSRGAAACCSNRIRRLAAEGPLVVVDDEQWLDPASARVLAFALCRLRDEPVCVLLARRPADSVLWPELERSYGDAGLSALVLRPLSADEVGRLIEAQVGRPVMRWLQERIYAVSGGNPLYALAIADELESRPMSARPTSRFRSPGHWPRRSATGWRSSSPGRPIRCWSSRWCRARRSR